MKLKVYRIGKTDYAISEKYQVFRMVRKKWTLLEHCKSFDEARLCIFRIVADDKGMVVI